MRLRDIQPNKLIGDQGLSDFRLIRAIGSIEQWFLNPLQQRIQLLDLARRAQRRATSTEDHMYNVNYWDLEQKCGWASTCASLVLQGAKEQFSRREMQTVVRATGLRHDAELAAKYWIWIETEHRTSSELVDEFLISYAKDRSFWDIYLPFVLNMN